LALVAPTVLWLLVSCVKFFYDSGYVMQPTGFEGLTIRQLDQCIDFTVLHRVNPQRYPFILESSAQTEDVLASTKKIIPHPILIVLNNMHAMTFYCKY